MNTAAALKNELAAKIDTRSTDDVWTIFHMAQARNEYHIECAARSILRSRGISTR